MPDAPGARSAPKYGEHLRTRPAAPAKHNRTPTQNDDDRNDIGCLPKFVKLSIAFPPVPFSFGRGALVSDFSFVAKNHPKPGRKRSFAASLCNSPAITTRAASPYSSAGNPARIASTSASESHSSPASRTMCLYNSKCCRLSQQRVRLGTAPRLGLLYHIGQPPQQVEATMQR
jgi:hypothetical protein